MADELDPKDVASAEALDAAIDLVLAGRAGPAADPTITWLAAALRPAPPPALTRRIAAEQEQREQARWWPAQVAAAALAALLLSHGIGNLVNGAWVARNIGEDYSPHAFLEGGVALLAAGVAVAAGVVRRSWLPVSVLAGVPLGLALGVNGVREVGEFAAGAVLHLSQGTIAVGLAALWWRARRYGGGPADEGGA